MGIPYFRTDKEAAWAAPGPTRARETHANADAQISLDVAGGRRPIGPVGLGPHSTRPGRPREPGAAVGTYAGTRGPRGAKFSRSPVPSRPCASDAAGFDSYPGSHFVI